MSPVQRRVIHALQGAPYEDQVASLGFALIHLLATESLSPVEEFDGLTGAIRDLLVSALKSTGENKRY